MSAAAIYAFADSDDPTRDMLREIGDLSKIDINGARVLLWTYIRPRKSKGGIIFSDSAVKEDLWQGTVGYVLKAGPVAFKDDGTNDFGGFSVEPGDWVTFRTGDTRRVQINGVDCRLAEDTVIEMKIADPQIITHRQ